MANREIGAGGKLLLFCAKLLWAGNRGNKVCFKK